METRVLEKNGYFYPQYRVFINCIFSKDKWVWKNFKKWYAGSDYPPYSFDYQDDAEFGNLESAKKFIEQKLNKNIEKIHTV